MFWIAIVVFVVAAVMGILLRLASPPLVDEPLSDTWRREHVREHGDGEVH